MLPEEKAYLAVDASKVQRAKEYVIAKARELGEIRTQEENIECLMFDSRIYLTKVRHFDDETCKFYPCVEKEDHYTLYTI